MIDHERERPHFSIRPSGAREINPFPEGGGPVKIMVFIDGENLRNAVRELGGMGRRFSYDSMFSLLSNNGVNTMRVNFYTHDAENIPSGLLEFLLKRKIRIMAIPGKVVHGEIKAGPVDLDIATDMVDMVDQYEEAVLVGGDGDFGYPVEKVIEKGKKVTVITSWKRAGIELAAAGAQTIFLDDLIPMLTMPRRLGVRRPPDLRAI